jgi:purine nucleoside permease
MNLLAILALLLAALLVPLCADAAPKPIPVKVVVVTMFERGEDTGDVPGEYQLWVEREHLDRVIPMPAGYRHVRMNQDGVLGMVTGVGTAKAAASVMALGLDPRFDLSHAYWLVAGIGGGDPADVSLGSAVWAEHVVDGDLAYELDAREIPSDWPTGYVPLRKTKPYELPMKDEFEGEFYALNPKLVDWAYRLTRGIALEDTEKMQTSRARFTGFPNAQKPPFVAKGDAMSGGTFWHGAMMDAWANKWVNYYTGGNYMISAMEDTGTLQSLTFLSKAGKVDMGRVMVLRTVSNYDMQWPGATAAESLQTMTFGAYSAYMPALEAAQRVGHAVVSEILKKWPAPVTPLSN